MKTRLIIGDRVRVLNKFDDEIADGFVTGLTKAGFELDGRDNFLFRHVKSVTPDFDMWRHGDERGFTIRTTITGASL